MPLYVQYYFLFYLRWRNESQHLDYIFCCFNTNFSHRSRVLLKIELVQDRPWFSQFYLVWFRFGRISSLLNSFQFSTKFWIILPLSFAKTVVRRGSAFTCIQTKNSCQKNPTDIPELFPTVFRAWIIQSEASGKIYRLCILSFPSVIGVLINWGWNAWNRTPEKRYGNWFCKDWDNWRA